MSYQVLVTFDLKDASSKDYENAYADLQTLGLKKVHKGTSRDVVIPTTTVMGNFNGASSAKVAQDIRDAVKNKFKLRNLQSEIFVIAGENGSWASAVT